jgi:hypothetical protein
VLLGVAVLAKAASFPARALFAWTAAGLAGLRSILLVLDYVKTERVMDALRAATARTSGLTYGREGQMVNQFDDLSSQMINYVGAGLVVFWAVVAVAFWDKRGGEAA